MSFEEGPVPFGLVVWTAETHGGGGLRAECCRNLAALLDAHFADRVPVGNLAVVPGAAGGRGIAGAQIIS
jgi:hypothetical protein